MGFKTLDTRIYAICGILAVLVMSVDVIIGIILDPTWNFNDNVICDLGVSDDATIATSFLISCCASGILFIISSMMWMSKDSKLMKMTGIFTILSGISLMAVGILDKTTDPVHQFMVIIYATLFIIAIAFACIEDIKKHNYTLVFGFAILAVYGVISLFGVFPYILTQFLLMSYVFVWYLLNCIGEFNPSTESLRRIIGLD